MIRTLTTVALTLFATVAAAAIPFGNDEVVVAVTSQLSHDAFQSLPTRLEIRAQNNQVQFGASADVRDLAFDRRGFLLTADAFGVRRFDRGGRPLQTLVDGAYEPLALTLDGAQRLYVALRSGLLLRLNTDGELTRRYGLTLEGASVTALDLGRDQCTLYYSHGTRISRFDVCSGSYLGIFADLPNEVGQVRVLSDDSVLAALGDRVERIDSRGVIVRTYASLGDDAVKYLSVAANGRTVWIGGRHLQLLNLTSGVVTQTKRYGNDPSVIRVQAAVAREARAAASIVLPTEPFLTVESRDIDSAILMFAPAFDADSYELQFRTEDSSWETLRKLGTADRRIFVGDLEFGTQYSFRVVAINENGATPSNEATVP